MSPLSIGILETLSVYVFRKPCDVQPEQGINVLVQSSFQTITIHSKKEGMVTFAHS